MCGFVMGIFSPDRAPGDDDVLNALRSIGHRGPDGSDWCRFDLPDGRTAIVGHVRLALVGIEDGRQPFVGDRHVTVVNGELYDWRRYRRDLEDAGARFRTSTDSEVVHAAYSIAGSPPWPDLPGGEWTAAILDLATATIHAACDPFGTKPLRHWTSGDGRSFAVASEAKALFALGVRPELDPIALRFTLGLQYLPLGATLFRNVSMLPPGHRIELGSADRKPRPWTDLALGAPAERTDDRPLLEVLRDAVRRRLPSERSFATHLSGGLDSAVILGLASEAAGPGIEAFVADFDFGPNETRQAAETARHFGASLVPVRITASSMIGSMVRAARHSEGLCINGHAAAKLAIADSVRSRGHRCVLTGEGADEAFWGYEHLRIDAGLAMHRDAADNTRGVHRPAFEVDWLGGLARSLGQPVPGFVRTKAAMTAPLCSAFGPAMTETGFDPSRLASALPTAWSDAVHAMDGAHAARAMWNLHGLSGYILRGLDDAMGMSRGVESRLAFLDAEIQTFGASIAPKDHFDAEGLEKAVLREAVRGIVPDAVVSRRKAPFMAPMLSSTTEGMRGMRDLILGGRLVPMGLFDHRALERLTSADRTDPVLDANLMTLSSLSCLIHEFSL